MASLIPSPYKQNSVSVHPSVTCPSTPSLGLGAAASPQSGAHGLATPGTGGPQQMAWAAVSCLSKHVPGHSHDSDIRGLMPWQCHPGRHMVLTIGRAPWSLGTYQRGQGPPARKRHGSYPWVKHGFFQ